MRVVESVALSSLTLCDATMPSNSRVEASDASCAASARRSRPATSSRATLSSSNRPSTSRTSRCRSLSCSAARAAASEAASASRRCAAFAASRLCVRLRRSASVESSWMETVCKRRSASRCALTAEDIDRRCSSLCCAFNTLRALRAAPIDCSSAATRASASASAAALTPASRFLAATNCSRNVSSSSLFLAAAVSVDSRTPRRSFSSSHTRCSAARCDAHCAACAAWAVSATRVASTTSDSDVTCRSWSVRTSVRDRSSSCSSEAAVPASSSCWPRSSKICISSSPRDARKTTISSWWRRNSKDRANRADRSLLTSSSNSDTRPRKLISSPKWASVALPTWREESSTSSSLLFGEMEDDNDEELPHPRPPKFSPASICCWLAEAVALVVFVLASCTWSCSVFF